MEKFRKSLFFKVALVVTAALFAVASISPDFMFGLIGDRSGVLDTTYINLYQTCLIGYQTTIGVLREAGVFVLLAFLLLMLFLYIFYRIGKSIHGRYKTANKSLVRDAGEKPPAPHS